jgi:predicted ATP-dependent serine protease
MVDDKQDLEVCDSCGMLDYLWMGLCDKCFDELIDEPVEKMPRKRVFDDDKENS